MTKHRDKNAQKQRVARAWLKLESALRIAEEDGEHAREWVESVKLAKDHCEKAMKLDP